MVCAHDLHASAQGESDTAKSQTNDEQVMEEVIVQGQKTTIQLSKAVVQARLDFWDMYNSLNDIEEYRVVCEKVAATGTNIKKLQCAPQYYHDKARELTYNRSASTLSRKKIGLSPPSHRTFVAASLQKKKEADEHMIALIEKHPELRRRFEFLVETNEEYEHSKTSD